MAPGAAPGAFGGADHPGGPRLSFTETITDNVALVRRRIKDPGLAIEQIYVGRKSLTDVRILYLKDMAPPKIVDEVRRRLLVIDTDVILDSGVIANLIRDHPFSLFSTIRSTERPDSASADLNEGRVIILVDTTPFALIMPNSFYMFFTSPEDYYIGFLVLSMLRIMRLLGFLGSVFATPVYIALTTFHHELIPLPLLLNILATGAGVPFPTALNALAAEVVIEVLREAGVRLPAQFGPAVSIVGALVLGQAAVQAGFISPGLVIVIAFATIASFAVPRTEAIISFRLLRLPILLFAAILGFYGIAMGTIVVIYHLASMKSFGVPFLGMITPGRVSELGDELFLLPEQVSRPVRPAVHVDRVRRGPAPELKDPKEEG